MCNDDDDDGFLPLRLVKVEMNSEITTAVLLRTVLFPFVCNIHHISMPYVKISC